MDRLMELLEDFDFMLSVCVQHEHATHFHITGKKETS